MDKFEEIAKQYFEEFEGTHLYPKLRSWVGLLWLAAFGYAGYLFVYQTLINHVSPATWKSVLAVGAMMVAYGTVLDHKNRTLTQRNSSSSNLQSARIKTLERLTGVSPSDFLQLANDLTSLMRLRQQHCTQPLRPRDFVPIPWPRGQVLMHALTLAGVLVTAVGTFFPELVSFVRSYLTIQTLITWCFQALIYAALFLFLYPQFIYIWHHLRGDCRKWRARLDKNGAANTVHIEHLVKHLIKFHNPMPSKQHASKVAKPYTRGNYPRKRKLR